MPLLLKDISRRRRAAYAFQIHCAIIFAATWTWRVVRTQVLPSSLPAKLLLPRSFVWAVDPGDILSPVHSSACA
jgi:hypothetical protein